jgi:hypothetical protein
MTLRIDLSVQTEAWIQSEALRQGILPSDLVRTVLNEHATTQTVMALRISDDDRLKFYSLTERWIEETSLMSDLTDIALHPAYQQIIGMGRKVVPLILQELNSRPYHWFWALNAITGIDPAPKGGNFHDARLAWLNWGHETGIIE